MSASVQIFRWVMSNGEGAPAEDIYKHEWLLDIPDTSDDDKDDGNGESVSPNLSDERKEEISDWDLSVSKILTAASQPFEI